jgi:hypothetical protein
MSSSLSGWRLVKAGSQPTLTVSDALCYTPSNVLSLLRPRAFVAYGSCTQTVAIMMLPYTYGIVDKEVIYIRNKDGYCLPNTVKFWLKSGPLHPVRTGRKRSRIGGFGMYVPPSTRNIVSYVDAWEYKVCKNSSSSSRLGLGLHLNRVPQIHPRPKDWLPTSCAGSADPFLVFFDGH